MDKNDKRNRTVTAAAKANQESLLRQVGRDLRDEIEAEDVLQETFAELIEVYDLGETLETVGAWLMRVARNKVIDRFRRRKIQRRHFETTRLEETTSGPTPDDERTRQWLREEIATALEHLPPEQAEVFVLHELEGKTFEQISAETGVNVNTLLSRKRYALEFLRQYLKEVYDELE